MRVHHVEQVVGGLCTLELPPLALLDQTQIDGERLRHLLWNGHHNKACEALGRITSWAKDVIVLNEPGIDEGQALGRTLHGTAKLHRDQHGRADRLRHAPPGRQADSTSRAEGTVNQLVNARMNKRRQMRWSPRGAHRVLQVRAAVLDGRLGHQAIQPAA